MKSILQNMTAVVASIFVGILLLAAIEFLGTILYPFPSDFAGTREEVAQHVANYPVWILALLGGAGWGITMFITTGLATRLNANRLPAYGVGVGILLLAGAIFNMAMLPYPIWYWVLQVALLPLGIYLGIKVGVAQSRPH